MNYIEKYYKWILANPTKVNEKIKTIYQRLVEDIKKPRTITVYNPTTEENEVHTFVFDETLGERPVRFIELFCKHSKGKWAGKSVELELWQKAMLSSIFGIVDSDGLRQFREVLLVVGRKNGKSLFASAIAN